MIGFAHSFIRIIGSFPLISFYAVPRSQSLFQLVESPWSEALRPTKLVCWYVPACRQKNPIKLDQLYFCQISDVTHLKLHTL